MTLIAVMHFYKLPHTCQLILENFQDIQLVAENDESIGDTELVQVQKKENVIEKSLDKLKDTSRVSLCSISNSLAEEF